MVVGSTNYKVVPIARVNTPPRSVPVFSGNDPLTNGYATLPDALRLSGLRGDSALPCRPDKAFTPHPAR